MVDAQELSVDELATVTRFGLHKDEWEYGFYDSDVGPHPIWWYTFGGLVGHATAESAKHTGSKSCFGWPVIVRRHPGSSEWEAVGDSDE